GAHASRRHHGSEEERGKTHLAPSSQIHGRHVRRASLRQSDDRQRGTGPRCRAEADGRAAARKRKVDMTAKLSPSALALKLRPFPERIAAQYEKTPPTSPWDGNETRPSTWRAEGGTGAIPAGLHPTPLRGITTVSVAPDGTVAIGGPDGLAALENG